MVGDRWEAKEKAMENDVNGAGTVEVAQGRGRGVVNRFRWDGRSARLFGQYTRPPRVWYIGVFEEYGQVKGTPYC